MIETIENGEALEKKHLDHPLSGDYEGNRECRIKPNELLVYKIDEKENILTLSRTGTHRDLFE